MSHPSNKRYVKRVDDRMPSQPVPTVPASYYRDNESTEPKALARVLARPFFISVDFILGHIKDHNPGINSGLRPEDLRTFLIQRHFDSDFSPRPFDATAATIKFLATGLADILFHGSDPLALQINTVVSGLRFIGINYVAGVPIEQFAAYFYIKIGRLEIPESFGIQHFRRLLRFYLRSNVKFHFRLSDHGYDLILCRSVIKTM